MHGLGPCAQAKLLEREAAERQQASLDAAFAQLDWEAQGFLSRPRLGCSACACSPM